MHKADKDPLLRQPDRSQRFSHGSGKRRRASNAGELAAVAKRRMQFQNLRRGGLGFFQTSKLCERRRQLHVRNAVGRIGVDGLIGSTRSLIVTAEMEMAHRLRVVSREGPGIERAETHSPFAPLDGAFRFAAPSKHHAAKDVGQCT